MTLSEFFFDIPIYENIQINAENLSVFKKILNTYNTDEFEGYNPWQKLESTFKVTTYHESTDSQFSQKGGYAIVNIKCKRSDNIFTYYLKYDAETNILMKIGQYPTIADFHIAEIKQYTKLLSNEKLREFTKAIGLAANGVGIGSFVYLRRIFESLILEAYQVALSEQTINESEFQRLRMDQKIDLLAVYLPEFLVQNKSMYSILSLGIHELSEQKCLAHFDTLRVGIEIILDEKLEILRKKEKIQQAQKKLAALKGDIQK